MGGSKSIIDALIRGITKNGGQIQLSSHVEEVRVAYQKGLKRSFVLNALLLGLRGNRMLCIHAAVHFLFIRN